MHPLQIRMRVREALLEDLGRGGDITSEAVIQNDRTVAAAIIAHKSGIIFGHACALVAFSILDSAVAYRTCIPDGSEAAAGQTVATIHGSARAMLGSERTALNFLGHLSGIATATRAMVEAVAGTRARIVDTRKTTPGLRSLEKAAVIAGGGCNHRFGLDDGILIKDNHVAIAGGIRPAVERARAHAGHMIKIEVEVDTLAQLRELAGIGVDAVLLDNMTPAQLREAVSIVNGTMVTEASGNVTVATAREIALTGVDLISSGAITHSAPALDLGLQLTTAEALRPGRRPVLGSSRPER